MEAEDSKKKLKRNKNTKKIKEGVYIFVQKEEKLARASEEKKRKKKTLQVQTRNRDEPDEPHLSNYKDESNASSNAYAEKKRKKSSQMKKRKKDRPAETESVEIDQSNEREDGLGQENNKLAEVDEHEKRKSRKKKKRKSEKMVGRNASVDLDDDSDHQRGKPKDLIKIVEKPTEDNLVEERGQAGEEEIYELSSGDEDCSKGMKKWVTDYYQSRPGLEVLQERIDEFITDYEAKKEQERKEKEARAAEGGWTVVVHHKGRKKTTDSETGIAVGSVSQAAVMDNIAKKKKNDVGLDFYRFQKREEKRNEIMLLQSKFEQDKKRIQQLRAARKFRPY